MINQIHSHLQEFGIAVSKGRHKLKRELADIFETTALSPLLYELLHDLLAAMYREEERVAALRFGAWIQGERRK